MSIGTLYQKRYCAHMDLRTGSFMQFTAAALAMWICSLYFEEQIIIWAPQLLITLAWLVIGLSLGAVTLLWVLVRHGEVERVASIFFLVPPVTAVMAWFCFGETMGFQAIIGMALAIVGVFIVCRKN